MIVSAWPDACADPFRARPSEDLSPGLLPRCEATTLVHFSRIAKAACAGSARMWVRLRTCAGNLRTCGGEKPDVPGEDADLRGEQADLLGERADALNWKQPGLDRR